LRALRIAQDMCAYVADISDHELNELSSVPAGYVVKQPWSIRRRLLSARSAARRYTRSDSLRHRP
jgi:hypothetical protein